MSHLLRLTTCLFFLASFSPASLHAAYPDVVLADNPMAYWRLGETSGNTAVNQGSLASAADGTYSGLMTWGVKGLIDNEADTAVDFQGGHVRMSNVNGINRRGPFEEKSIELWFRADSLSRRQVLYEQGGGTRGLAIYLDGGTLYVCGWNRANDGGRVAAPWGNSPAPLSVSTTIEAGRVYYVALVMDGDSNGFGGSIDGYLNGRHFGQVSGVGLLYNHNPAVIGTAVSGIRFHDNDTSTNNRSFDGVIDEVALYDTALTASQIRAHFDAGSNGSSPAGVRILKWVEVQ